MLESASAASAASDAGESWASKLNPFKKSAHQEQAAAAAVSGATGGVLSYDGPVPPVDAESEAEILLAKQQLLMNLLDDTEEALRAKQG